MGRGSLDDMLAFDGASDRVIIWHLTANHYPPLPLSLLPCVKRAIELANEGRMDELIHLPGGISWKGQNTCPVWAAVDGWHLNAFLDGDTDD